MHSGAARTGINGCTGRKVVGTTTDTTSTTADPKGSLSLSEQAVVSFVSVVVKK
jgi:hypothetical protein